MRDRDHQDTCSPLILNESTLCYVINCSKTFFINLLEFPDKIDKKVRHMLPLKLDVIRVFLVCNQEFSFMD